jgi:cytochrome c oxidase subunit 2
MSYLSGSGTKAYPVVALTWGLAIISAAVVIIIAVLLLWGVAARTQANAFGPLNAAVERTSAGVSWITIGVGISSVALVVSLIWTVAVLASVAMPPKPPLTIEVTGHQWWWEARYVNPDPTQVFATANELHIPTGEPVRVVLHGADVIHSFWVPALTGKTDTIPGQTNETWLEADRAGRYQGMCTEYCGLQHAHMMVFVTAESPAAFEAWRRAQVQPAAAPANPDLTAGEQLFVLKCGACHAVRGTDAGGHVAPDLTHLMSRQTIAAGAAPNTPAGLSGWIADPQSVKPGTLMPTLYLSGPEIKSVRTYLETLQ